MTARILILLALLMAIPACGRNANSPLNLFGGARAVDADTTTAETDPRPLIDQITDLKLERVPGGAIIRATGLPQTQGYFDGALLVMNGGAPLNGVLSYQFRVNPPPSPQRPGTPTSREVIVGQFVSDQTLEAIRSIQVSGQRNALAVGR